MTTKKSKPASLTSALLARKGEAEPVTDRSTLMAPIKMAGPRGGNGNGNGNGSDHELEQDEDVFRRLTSKVRSERTYVPSPTPQPEAVQAVSADREARLQAQTAGQMPVQPAVEAERPASAARTESGGGEGTSARGESTDEADAELRRESARDARLLRFVYGMAALTGILAIILYGSDWLMERQDTASTVPVAGETAEQRLAAEPAAPAAETTGTETAESAPAPAGPSPSSSIAMPEPIVIPPAPPAPRETVAPTGQREPAASSEAASSEPGAAPPPSAAPIGAVASAPLPGDTAAASVPTPVPPSITAPRSAGEQPSSAAPDSPAGSRAEPAAGETAGVQPPSSTAAAAPPAPEQPAAGDSADTRGAAQPERPETSLAARTPPSKPAPVTDPGAPGFYIQLSSLRSEDAAQREWTRLQKALPDALGGRSLVVEQREIAGRGTFFRVQTGGFGTLKEAQDFCATLQARNQPCLAIRK